MACGSPGDAPVAADGVLKNRLLWAQTRPLIVRPRRGCFRLRSPRPSSKACTGAGRPSRGGSGEERPGLLKVGRVVSFGEPAIRLRQQLVAFGRPAPVPQ